MAGNIKIQPTLFLVYDYDKEEDYINSMSKKGWQLKKGGLIHHTYERSDESYRYKLDYNNKVNFSMDEHHRYITLFAEQGWERINSTINGWHYFRKKYDSTLPEEEYELYTDDTSLKEMLGRWNRIARILQVIFALLTTLYLFIYFSTGSLIMMVDILIYVVGIILFEVCILGLKSKRVSSRPRNRLSRYGGYILFGSMFLILFLMLFFVFFQPYSYKIDYSTQINQDTPDYTDTLTIKHSGHYQIDFKCKSERGEVMVEITKDNYIVFNGGGCDFSNSQIDLKAGEYTVKVVYNLENYRGELNTTQNQMEDINLSDDPDKMSDVDVFVGLKRSLY